MTIYGTANQAFSNEVYIATYNAFKELMQRRPEFVSGSQTYRVDTVVEESTVSEINYISPSIYKLDSSYNYYTEYYEDTVKNEIIINETGLPSLYVLGDDLNNKTIYQPIITVGGKIDINPMNQENTTDYFDQYVFEYQKNPVSRDSEFDFYNLTNLQKNVYFTSNGLKRLEDINKNQYLMPYGNKITLKTNEFSLFAAILEQSDFTDIFSTSILYRERYGSFVPDRFKILKETPVLVGDKVEVNRTITEETVRKLKFDSISEFNDSTESTLRDLVAIRNSRDFSVFRVGELPPRQLATEESNYTIQTRNSELTARLLQANQSNSLSNKIRTLIFSKRINQFIENIKLSPTDFINGKSFHSETFMYELQKMERSGRITQNFYIPNLNDIEEVNIFDSQVKFGKNYNYALKGYNFCLGQMVNVDLINGLSSQQWVQIIDEAARADPALIEVYALIVEMSGIIIERNISITEQQYKNMFIGILTAMLKLNLEAFIYYPTFFKTGEMFNDQMAVYDHPPPPPEVEIDGFIGIDNKILLRLNGSISEFKAAAVIIQPEDREIFDRNVLVQKLDSIEQQMMFDGDDRPAYFQIFKIEQHPKDYSDFKDNFVTASTVYQLQPLNVNFQSSDVIKNYHTSYVDKVEANKKYYYMFRTVDVHGNISNPSPIYEIELVNEQGTIFPLIKTVEFLKIEDKQPTKLVRRFLHIVPNAIQSFVNEEQSGYFDENGEPKQSAELVKNSVTLGLTDQRLWNKTYRLKVKSKVTGKIIEIDFKFKTSVLQNPVISR